MSALRYARAALWADLARGVAGAAVTAVPLLAGELPRWLGVVLVLLLTLFLAHLAVTVRRAVSRIVLDDDRLRVLPGGPGIEWARLDTLHLDYFSTRRDGRDGWMQLRLGAGRRRVRVDSSLHGFERVLERALRAAGDRGLDLSPATAANLACVRTAPDAPAHSAAHGATHGGRS